MKFPKSKTEYIEEITRTIDEPKLRPDKAVKQKKFKNIPTSDVLFAIRKTFGIVSNICKNLQVDYRTFMKIYNDRPEVREAVEAEKEYTNDLLENVLLTETMMARSPYDAKRNAQLLIYIAEVRLGNRGYARKTEYEKARIVVGEAIESQKAMAREKILNCLKKRIKEDEKQEKEIEENITKPASEIIKETGQQTA